MQWLARLHPASALAASLAPGIDMLAHGRPTPRLSRLSPDLPRATLPRLSVIVPVRNEEAAVRTALSSLLQQDYPDFELIVVNDRSTDRTAEILVQLSAEHADRLRVVTVDTLPPGWLGKPHALWLGAQSASGAWLLFTDADVVFAPSCLRRAVAYAERASLDHLTLGPRIVTGSIWLGAFVAYFTFLLVISLRLYLVNDAQSNVGMGLGAFNLVLARTYQAIGTYASVARRPDDDVRIGQHIRSLGFRQQLLDGTDLLQVEWYPSLRAAVLGLEKNFFAGYEYNLAAAIASNALLLFAYVWPWAAIFRSRGPRRWLWVGAIAAQMGTFLRTRPSVGMHDAAYALLMPFSAALVSYTALRSTVLTLLRGGIQWRGTFYPLRELRRG